MKTLLRYPGGKSRMIRVLRPYLAELVENEPCYAEPFVGGGSVALEVARTNPRLKLFLNDKDDLVSSLWKIICGSERDVEALCGKLNILPTEPLYQRIKETEFIDTIDKAFKGLFLNRTSFNGMIHNSSPSGGAKQSGKWTLDSEYKPAVLARLLHEYHLLLRGRTTVSCEDAINFIRRHNGSSMFVDPPYFPDRKPNKLYGIYMTREEHQRLVERLASVHKCVVTYDYCETIRAMFLVAGFSLNASNGNYSSGKAKHGYVVDDGTGSTQSQWKVKVELIATKGIEYQGCTLTPIAAGHH